MKTSASDVSARSNVPLLVVGGSAAMVAATAGLAARRIAQNKRRLHESAAVGRATSATLAPTDQPLTSFNRYGQPGDPINFECVGTQGQVGAAFAAASWYRADEIDLVTSARISA
ncbi:MAG: LssY C-terminal domain-containing protein, partial [Ktedonobacterales bacterium]